LQQSPEDDFVFWLVIIEKPSLQTHSFTLVPDAELQL